VKELAPGLFQLGGFPPNGFNAYLMGGVLVDSATNLGHRRILRQLKGHTVEAHALTHAHPDHQGSSRRICEALGVPYWVGAADADAAESGDLSGAMPSGFMSKFSQKAFAGPGHPVSRRLVEGDEVGGFQVLETPGHSPGHVAFWRASDRVLVQGDVVFGMNPFTGIPGLRPPFDFFTRDISENRRSAQRLAELEPALVCFGHGPAMRDTQKFVSFVRDKMRP
jgi:glyoxylase-like metal-dependent hydrolase (beta-lactamase superfamily II)